MSCEVSAGEPAFSIPLFLLLKARGSYSIPVSVRKWVIFNRLRSSKIVHPYREAFFKHSSFIDGQRFGDLTKGIKKEKKSTESLYQFTSLDHGAINKY